MITTDEHPDLKSDLATRAIPITIDKRKLINALIPLLKDSAILKALVSIGSNNWDDWFDECFHKAARQPLDADIVDAMEELLKEMMIDA